MTVTRAFTPSPPPSNIPFYNGLDEEGCYYFNARWYDASTGRFISEDPARDGQNWHIYVSNNPLRYIDPSGMYQTDYWNMSDEEVDESRAIRDNLDSGNSCFDSGNNNSGSDPSKKKDSKKPEDPLNPVQEGIEPIIPGQELPDEVIEILAPFIADMLEFTGVLSIGTGLSGSIFLSGIIEKGTAYIVEEGIIMDSFGYKSTSYGGQTDIGISGSGILTALPDAGKSDFLGSSTTTGLEADVPLASAGIYYVVTSTGKEGISITLGAGLSVLNVSLSAYHDNVVESRR